jgi:hypothetical protein
MSGERGERQGMPSGESVFLGLRSQALTIGAAALNLAPSAELPHVFGVLMDTSMQSGTATLLVLADNTVSLYLSSGGAMLGCGGHEHAARAGRRLLLTAESHLEVFEAGQPDAIPAPGQILITVRTHTGPLRARGAEQDLGQGRHPASPVFHAAHDVITELRLLDEQRSRAGQEPPAPG